MPEQVLMAQVDAANQVSQLLAASGSKTFAVGKVAATTGNAGLITLTPSAGGSAVAVKLEGARQVADLSALVGKTVAISKPSLLAGAGAGNSWLMFQPVKAGAVKATASSVTMLKLEGARQGMQAASLTGQKFTVVQPMMAGKAAGSTLFLQPAAGGDLVALKMANTAPAVSGLIGKTVTVGQAPMIAGGQNGAWLALKPTLGATMGKAAGGTVAVKAAAAAPVVKAQGVAMATATTPSAAQAAMLAKGGSGTAIGMTAALPAGAGVDGAANAMVVKGGAGAKMGGMGALPPGVEIEGLRNGMVIKGGGGTLPPGVEIEGLRNGMAAKAGAATKGAGAKVGAAAKGAGTKMAGASAKAGGAKIAATATTTTKAVTVAKATPVAGGVGGAKMVNVVALSSKGGTGMTAAKGAGIGGVLGVGVGGWGIALIGTLGAAAAYGYYRSRRVEAELSTEEQSQTASV